MKLNKKIIRALSLGVVSLGLLAGVGMSSNNIHADHIAGEISNKYLEPASQIESDSDKTEAGEIYTGIQQCKKYPQIAASAAAGSGRYIFQQHKNQILPYYNKAQMKEFIKWFAIDADEGYTIDSKGDIHPPKASHHVNKTNKHSNKRINKSKRHNKRTRDKKAKHLRLSKKLSAKLNKQLRNDKKALRSRKARHSYKYRKSLNKAIKKLQNKLKVSK